MTRKNQGKPRLAKTLLFPDAMEGLARVIEFGEEKYSPAEKKDWMMYDDKEVADSLVRHLQAHLNGEIIDPESGLPHTAHIMFNSAVLCELTTGYSSSGSVELKPREDLSVC